MYIQKKMHTGDYTIVDDKNRVLDKVSGVVAAHGLDRTALRNGKLVEYKGKFMAEEYPQIGAPFINFY